MDNRWKCMNIATNSLKRFQVTSLHEYLGDDFHYKLQYDIVDSSSHSQNYGLFLLSQSQPVSSSLVDYCIASYAQSSLTNIQSVNSPTTINNTTINLEHFVSNDSINHCDSSVCSDTCSNTSSNSSSDITKGDTNLYSKHAIIDYEEGEIASGTSHTEQPNSNLVGSRKCLPNEQTAQKTSLSNLISKYVESKPLSHSATKYEKHKHAYVIADKRLTHLKCKICKLIKELKPTAFNELKKLAVVFGEKFQTGRVTSATIDRILAGDELKVVPRQGIIDTSDTSNKYATLSIVANKRKRTRK
jgi:hypothetical protein